MKITRFFNKIPLHVHNNTYYFLEHQQLNSFLNQRDFIDTFKTKAKMFMRPLYSLSIYIFSPVMPRIHWKSKQLYINYLTEKYLSSSSVGLQVGSGVSASHNNIINLDIFDYPGVDVVADATLLPFKNNSMHSYFSSAVLEHISDPEKMIGEAFRVLAKNGIIITGAPFIQGFHASPHDYTRWTMAGLRTIHERHGFETIEVVPFAGPASSLTWIIIDFFSLLISFGSKKLYFFFYFIFSVICFPIKILDLLLITYTESYRISSFFIYVGKKI